MLRELWVHPRKVWLRRACFQVHLWAGVGLAVYLVALSLSGSVLVFRQELTRWMLPAGLSRDGAVSPQAVMVAFARAEPAGTVSELQMPSAALPAYLVEGKDGAGRPARWWCDARTGELQAARRTWLDWLLELHDYLLLPQAWGMQANACGAAGLLVLAATGIVVWWQGVRRWTRGLRVKVRANWRRVNYDLHSAIGFWTLLIVSWWAISGVYFGFYRQVTAVVAVVSPLRGMKSPAGAAVSASAARTTLAKVLASGQAASPRGRLWSVSDPALHGGECYLLYDLRTAGDFSHRDIVRVSAVDARVLSVWRYTPEAGFTAGDWVLWAMHPLHFGTTLGMVGKVVWSLLGLSLAGLTISGVLMYWNRFLGKRWKALRS